MAQGDIFLKIKGIEGEAEDGTHGKEIPIQSFSWGVSNMSSVGHGMGSGTGKCTISSLNFSKLMDFSSCKLFLKCCGGHAVDDATLTVRKAGGEKALEYYIVKLKTCMIDNMQWSGADGGGQVSESFSLSFEEVTIDYCTQDKKTAGKGLPDKAGWHIKKHVPI